MINFRMMLFWRSDWVRNRCFMHCLRKDHHQHQCAKTRSEPHEISRRFHRYSSNISCSLLNIFSPFNRPAALIFALTFILQGPPIVPCSTCSIPGRFVSARRFQSSANKTLQIVLCYCLHLIGYGSDRILASNCLSLASAHILTKLLSVAVLLRNTDNIR